MPDIPHLVPTTVTQGQAPGLGYRIEGELVPALHVAIDGSVPIFFEHHVVLWKQPSVEIRLHHMAGAMTRMFAGMPIMMTEAAGSGQLAFSRDAPGHVLALHLQAGESILTREHGLLAATGNLDYSFTQVGGVASMLFGKQGLFVDRFACSSGEGVLWLHGHGNVFEVTLGAGEVIDVEPGSWLYRDESVGYSQQMMSLRTGFRAGGGNLVFNRLTGPGRVGLQSGFYESRGDAQSAAAGNSSKSPGLGGLLGGFLDPST